MQEFATEREALNFLVGKIAAEAKRENVPLSEIERKMLYFSETGWTLPDMAAVSAEFDQNCNQDEYEQKIAGLISKIEAHDNGHNRDELETWDAAVEKLSEGDHYLQVMIGAAKSTGAGFLPTLSRPSVRPPHDRLKLWLTALGMSFGFLALIFFVSRLFDPEAVDRVFGRNGLFSGFLALAVCVWLFRAQIRDMLQSLFGRK